MDCHLERLQCYLVGGICDRKKKWSPCWTTDVVMWAKQELTGKSGR